MFSLLCMFFFLPGYFSRSSFALSRFFSISLKKARSPLRILRSPGHGGCSMARKMARKDEVFFFFFPPPSCCYWYARFIY